MGELFVALVHYPVYNKDRQVVATSITPLDLHDLARSCVTFGVRRCYIVNPLPLQRQVARRIAAYWQSGFGGVYNRTRQEAFSVIALAEAVEDAEREIAESLGRRAQVVGTTARRFPGAVAYPVLAERIAREEDPWLLLFGTGWGMTTELLNRCDCVLEPITGPTPYNHLSVRAAASIILDRLRSRVPGEDAPAAQSALPHANEAPVLSKPH